MPEQFQQHNTLIALDFSLHAGLTITEVEGAKISLRKSDAVAGRPIPLKHYTLTLPPQQKAFTLHFNGTINHPVQGPGQEYARSFSYTPGIISNEGIFLANSTAWYPQFDDAMVSFRLDIQVPADWDAVSQGTLVREHKRFQVANWQYRNCLYS